MRAFTMLPRRLAANTRLGNEATNDSEQQESPTGNGAEQNEAPSLAGRRASVFLACVLAATIAFAFNMTGLAVSRNLANAGTQLPVMASMHALRGSATTAVVSPPFDASSIPPYEGKPTVSLNGNMPWFTSEDLSRDPLDAFESFSRLDELGRCATAFALVGPETMPTEPRGSIGMVKPSGWHTSRYDWIDGGYLYNRCHLIGYQLTGQNDNELNLITGTRTMNVQGMEPLEDRVASYVNRTGNHVLYRVTPVFEGDNLVASGVIMEAQSLEDDGAGIRFCTWCYNVEPGVAIDYATGDNHAASSAEGGAGATASREATSSGEAAGVGEFSDSGSGETSPTATEAEVRAYVLNMNTHRFHYPDCPSVSDMKEKNKKVVEMTRDEIIEMGYRPCGNCQP